MEERIPKLFLMWKEYSKEQFIKDIVAVSYTHLDVYKRQDILSVHSSAMAQRLAEAFLEDLDFRIY